MPRTQIDYSKTIMYRIICKNLLIKECYIGSTTNFKDRKTSHKSRCINSDNLCYHFNVYQYIRDNGGWDNWDMIEIEKYNATDGNDSRKRERYWIEYYNASLNKIMPTQTKKEYCCKISENRKIYMKKYSEDNKEILQLKKKELKLCICGCYITSIHMKRHERTKKHLDIITTGNYIKK